ncbi:apoptosis inducing factor mitochondria associated 4 [Megalops cyprinoides]|uniref:apoptosis inducing factor mitochondria associated 4 n=1 Tax=Megalops cyprinoides TaxID=118141 RepID=UPI0018648EBB|nr:apoptosis inducing factor mitochondria associated 4 [Megalops cyprinoides]
MSAKRTSTGSQGKEGDQDEVTAEVCHVSELQDGQMLEVEVGQQKVLLVRSEGEYSAVGSLCTHYGAPLSKGALSGSKVRCPWHGACFNVKTGDIEEYPGLDSLPCYKVKIENDKVFVTVSKKAAKLVKRVKEMGSRVAGVAHTVLLIGGGPASLQCADTLRQERYGGRIIMVTRDALLPYDKPKLSKMMNVDHNAVLLRQKEFFQQYDIEVWTRRQVDSVDTKQRTVTLSDGLVQHYDQLLIATGCRARALNCPGATLENVRLLQTPEDALRIHQACKGHRAVIVGTSFIGMEVASYLTENAASVTVVGSSELPYQKSLGPDIGKMTMQMLKEKKVEFYMSDGVAEIRGKDGKVKEVVLKSGVVLPADVVVAGIGVVPNSEFLKGGAIELDSKGAVIVDKCMRTTVPGVFSAGDVTSFPLALRGNQRVNIAHWQLAQAQGRVAALNMLDRHIEVDSVPFFWTVLLGKSIRYTGYGEGYTETVLKGNLEERKFLVFYIKDKEVVAAASLNFDPSVSQVANKMAAGKVITKAEAESEDLSWLKMP